MASPSSPHQRHRSCSKGEELFLVHLARSSPDDLEDEYDDYPPRSPKPKKSIGEELYEVHLKRSQGLAPDYDIAPEDYKQEVSKEEVKDSDGKQYNLRTCKA
eukprot:3706_1